MISRPPNILIIEEDAIVSRILQVRLVRDLNAVVFTAVSAEEGFRKLKDEKIDLLVLDIFLRNQTTLDLIKTIRDDPETNAIPIIVITVIGDKENTDVARELGIKDFVIKGRTSLKETSSMIKNVLEKRG